MKWNWKRPVAFLLSFAMMAGTLQGALSLPVSAATGDATLSFLNAPDGNKMTALPGDNLPIKITGKNGVVSIDNIVVKDDEGTIIDRDDVNNPIKLAPGGDPLQLQIVNKDVGSVAKDFSVTARLYASKDEGLLSINNVRERVDPPVTTSVEDDDTNTINENVPGLSLSNNLSSDILSGGLAVANLKKLFDDPPTPIPGGMAGTFTLASGPDTSISTSSRLKIVCSSNVGGTTPLFSVDGVGSGYFEGYKETDTAITGDGKLRITLKKTSGSDIGASSVILDLGNIDLSQIQPADGNQGATSIELYFQENLTNGIIVQIMSAQAMVNTVHEYASAEAGVGTMGVGEDDKSKYILLDENDSITTIGSDMMKLRRQDYQYTVPGDTKPRNNTIKWTWKPEIPNPIPDGMSEEIYNNAIRIQDDTTTGANDFYEGYVTAADMEIEGFLIPSVTYTGTGGSNSFTSGKDDQAFIDAHKVKVKILGAGIKPKVMYTGNTVKTTPNVFQTPEEFPNSLEMDYYDGRSSVVTKEETDPPRIVAGELRFGNKNKECSYVTINSSNPEALNFVYTDEAGLPAVYAGKINNPDGTVTDKAWGDKLNVFGNRTDEKFVKYEIRANPVNTTTDLTFDFYNSRDTLIYSFKTRIQVKDTSPNSDTTLKDIEIKQYRADNIFESIIENWAGGTGVDWEFNPNERSYLLTFGYKTQKVTFKPFFNYPKQTVEVSYPTDPNNPTQLTTKTLNDQEKTPQIALGEIGQTITVTFTVKGESGDTNPYVFELKRKAAGEDATLSELHVYDSADAESPDLVNFTGRDETALTVPYQTDKVLLKVVPNDRIGAEIEYITPDLEGEDSKTSTSREQWVPLVCELQNGLVVNNVTPIKIQVVAENGVDKKEYTVNVIREAPQHNTDLAGLKITNVAAEEETEGSGDLSANLKPAFATGKKEYSLTLDYGVEKINFAATLDPQYNSTMQLMSDNKRLEVLSTEKPSKTLTIKPGATVTYVIRVTAEDGSTMSDYSITVTRTAPSTDATLSGIDIVDATGTGDTAAGGGGAAGGTRLGVDNFLAETKKYTVTVDYVVTSVNVAAKVAEPKASKLTINGKNIELGAGTNGAGGAAGATATTSTNVKLDYPNTTITIIATAEDGVTTSKYVVTVKRNPPSDDARLTSLKVDPGTLSPLFVPSKTEYTATIEADDNRVNITAVPTEPHATMTIDGKELKSGEAYPLELVEVNQTVTIVVTAQDGKSQKTYTIRFTNKNLIKKSANADLKSLKLTKGEMSPVFKPSTLDYSFYTTEDTSYVDLYPVPSDPNASVRVMAGTLEIGDHNGNYSQTIVDGENEFTIEVTASDGVTIKTYTAMVYRNDEENMGSLTPLTIEDIDLEAESPIISSDITKRPRVSSEVFQELKNYPDKTLVLQGNDYSLQFAAKDLNTIIPDAVNYNFGMKFSSDSEAEIMDEINSYSGNQGLTPIFVEFNYHGELPGKATYTLSLGKQYANQKLYFHYYNEERGRIDYYGYITTNSQGTFSVPLSRLGTFIITPRRIAGSENKALVSTAAGSTANGNAASEEGVNLGNTEQVRNSKINPDTGFRAK